jgi:hypothetical protein
VVVGGVVEKGGDEQIASADAFYDSRGLLSISVA